MTALEQIAYFLGVSGVLIILLAVVWDETNPERPPLPRVWPTDGGW